MRIFKFPKNSNIKCPKCKKIVQKVGFIFDSDDIYNDDGVLDGAIILNRILILYDCNCKIIAALEKRKYNNFINKIKNILTNAK